jgi:hypothetical protein
MLGQKTSTARSPGWIGGVCQIRTRPSDCAVAKNRPVGEKATRGTSRQCGIAARGVVLGTTKGSVRFGNEEVQTRTILSAAAVRMYAPSGLNAAERIQAG